MSTSSPSVYSLVASDLEYRPNGDRAHRGPKPGQPPPADRYWGGCGGQLRSLYGREAVGEPSANVTAGGWSYNLDRRQRGSRKVRWVKSATLCTRCGAIWLEPGLLEAGVAHVRDGISTD